MSVVIKEIVSISSEGVTLRLSEKAALNGTLRTDQWFVSWDKIGRALFKDQYSDAVNVKDLQIDRERGL